ncbi:MAG: CYTH domain-containing protein [Candidatus Nanopelagicales bacterium]
MGVEIERKFLVVGDAWRSEVTQATHIVQGYLASTPSLTLRVRIRGDQAYLTIKGSSHGICRSEYEYEVPLADAEAMLAELAQGPVIDKVRHIVPIAGHSWEVDVFAGDNAGLVMAEVELASDAEDVHLPAWAGEEVSDDSRYYNVNLAANPFSRWAD